MLDSNLRIKGIQTNISAKFSHYDLDHRDIQINFDLNGNLEFK